MRLRFLIACMLLAMLPTLGMAQGFPPSVLSHRLLQQLAYWWRAVPGLTHSTILYNLAPQVLPWPACSPCPDTNGTLTNMGFTATSGWNATDRPGGAAHLAFDGTNDSVVTQAVIAGIPGNVLYTPPYYPMTLCTWVYMQAAPTGTNEMHLISANKGDVPYDGPILAALTSNSYAMFYLGTGGVAGVVRSDPTVIPLQRWTHVCGTYDGNGNQNGLRLYLNGQFVAVGATTTLTGNFTDYNIYLGNDRVTGTELNGRMDDTMVFRRGLSPGEVQQLYQASLTGYATLSPSLSMPFALGTVGSSGSFMPFFAR